MAYRDVDVIVSEDAFLPLEAALTLRKAGWQFFCILRDPVGRASSYAAEKRRWHGWSLAQAIEETQSYMNDRSYVRVLLGLGPQDSVSEKQALLAHDMLEQVFSIVISQDLLNDSLPLILKELDLDLTITERANKSERNYSVDFTPFSSLVQLDSRLFWKWDERSRDNLKKNSSWKRKGIVVIVSWFNDGGVPLTGVRDELERRGYSVSFYGLLHKGALNGLYEGVSKADCVIFWNWDIKDSVLHDLRRALPNQKWVLYNWDEPHATFVLNRMRQKRLLFDAALISAEAPVPIYVAVTKVVRFLAPPFDPSTTFYSPSPEYSRCDVCFALTTTYEDLVPKAPVSRKRFLDLLVDEVVKGRSNVSLCIFGSDRIARIVPRPFFMGILQHRDRGKVFSSCKVNVNLHAHHGFGGSYVNERTVDILGAGGLLFTDYTGLDYIRNGSECVLMRSFDEREIVKQLVGLVKDIHDNPKRYLEIRENGSSVAYRKFSTREWVDSFLDLYEIEMRSHKAYQERPCIWKVGSESFFPLTILLKPVDLTERPCYYNISVKDKIVADFSETGHCFFSGEATRLYVTRNCTVCVTPCIASNIYVGKANLTCSTFRESYFDITYYIGLSHSPNPAQVLQELVRITKKVVGLIVTDVAVSRIPIGCKRVGLARNCDTVMLSCDGPSAD
jgi:hypothetical protein